MRASHFLATFLLACGSSAFAVEIDGRIDEAEWAGAQHVTDFRMTQPLSRGKAVQPTEAWVLATEAGLAVAWHSTQPASIARTRQRTQRDADAPIDRVNLYIDFDGDGRTGYNFCVTLGGGIIDTVIANENQFNSDWDGNWRQAVGEDDEGWSVEMLIPWNIAPMSAAQDGKRTLGIGLDRVIGGTGERMGWPAVSYTETRFLSSLGKVEVAAFSQSLLAVTPYAVGVYDNIRGQADFDAGGDIFWKPNGQFQLTGTINPDFGQVESDDIVVNFSAIETFFSDKRPFFTENQAFFDVPFGSLSQASRLLYTRRVGARTDDGQGSGDVLAALKVNGSFGGINYGVFAATEGDQVGRDFYAARATRESDVHDFGVMGTYVERPFLDRTASVLGFDHRYTPTAQINVRTQVVGSNIDQAGVRTRDLGAQIQADYDAGNEWRHQVYVEHLGDNLQLNDFGFLERNNFNYARYQLGHRLTGFGEDSPYRSQDWRYAASARYNDQGLKIAYAASVNRQAELRDGGNSFFEAAAFTRGHDDLILRGNAPGFVRVPEKLYLFYGRFRPRKGAWQLYGNARIAAEGLHGVERPAVSAYGEVNYFFNDDLSVFTAVFARHNPDWLLWRGDNLLGTFRENTLRFDTGLNWVIGSQQELRIKLQALGLDAVSLQASRVAPDGTPVASDDAIDDFSLRNLGFQIRYRYELAPLSNLYVVYARGGNAFDEFATGAQQQLIDAFSLRDDEQLLVKLSYRFEI